MMTCKDQVENSGFKQCYKAKYTVTSVIELTNFLVDLLYNLSPIGITEEPRNKASANKGNPPIDNRFLVPRYF